MYWCFHCYAVNDHPAGPCDVCGAPVEEPSGLTSTDRLVWTLGDPDGDRALVAARILGKLRARDSVPALRVVAETGKDIYLREAALLSLLAIEGAEPLRSWLAELRRTAPFNLREIARRALEDDESATAGARERDTR